MVLGVVALVVVRGRGSFRGRGSGRNSRFINHGDYNNKNNNNNNNNHHHQRNNRYRGGRGRYLNRFRQNNNMQVESNNNNSRTITCYNCGRPGHISTECYSKKRQHNNTNNNIGNNHAATSSSTSDSSPTPTSSDNNKQNKKPRIEHAYVIISSSSSSSSSSSTAMSSSSGNVIYWILDGGATDHYACDKSVLRNIRRLPESKIITTANDTSTCHMIGNSVLNIGNNHVITLTDVHYMSDFKANLMSVPRIVESGAVVKYEKNSASIIRNGNVELVIPRVNNLYVLTSSDTSSSTAYTSSTSPIPVPSSSNNVKIINELKMLHLKHGHVNHTTLYKMIKNSSVINDNKILMNKFNVSEIMNEMKINPCVGCMEGKMNRSSMTGVVDYHVHETLDMFVADLMGPIKVESLNDNKYILMMMDVYSRYLLCELLKSKDEAADVIIKIITREQNQKRKKIKRFHSDNGKEIINGKLKIYFDKQGTIYTTTTIYTPQHNALIERKNRTVIEMTRAIMYHACAYIGLWGEAAMVSIYIINITTNKNDNIKTPSEKYNDIKPTIAHLHVWGCDVYYHNHQEKRKNKLDVTGIRGIFVGYDVNNNTYYRILDVEKNIIVTSHDVKFFDEKFDEMKKLCNIMNEENNNDHDQNNDKNINDFLPDSLFSNPSMILHMFGNEGNVGERNNETSNNNNKNKNTGKIMKNMTKMKLIVIVMK